jgi:YD repeat-containing protein
MKNVFGKQEELELFNKEGELVYDFKQLSNKVWVERTFNNKGNLLTYKDSDGFWGELTYDKNGNQLTYKNSSGFWSEYTYDNNGKELTHKDSQGFWYEYTYDENGNELTYKNSNGVSRCIPEYTMEELVKKLGNFKIKK